MAFYRHYACPDCGGTFKHMHVLSDDPPPDRCPLCGSWVSEAPPPVFVPQAPGIAKSAMSKSIDQTYNGIMDASIQRAEEAGAMLDDQLRAAGVDDETRRYHVAEAVSQTKITNLREPSEMREGDTAYIGPSSAAAAERLSIGASKPGFQAFGGAPRGSGANAQMVSQATADHNARATAMIAAGRMNR